MNILAISLIGGYFGIVIFGFLMSFFYSPYENRRKAQEKRIQKEK